MSEGKHGPVTPSGLNHLVINVRNHCCPVNHRINSIGYNL